MSDQTRWYSPDTLEIMEQVKSADGKKMVKATLVHARKLGLLPSVTSVMKETMATGHNLITWMKDQLMQACMSYPFDGDPENDEVVKKYKAMVTAKADEYGKHAADEGSRLHGYVQQWIESRGQQKTDDPVGARIIDFINDDLQKENTVDLIAEQSVGSLALGCAGTPDIYAKTTDGDIIYDLKTTNFEKYKKPYDSWKVQFGGYLYLTEANEGTRIKQAVSDRATGDTIFIEHENPEQWRQHYINCLENFFILKGYDPREV